VNSGRLATAARWRDLEEPAGLPDGPRAGSRGECPREARGLRIS